MSEQKRDITRRASGSVFEFLLGLKPYAPSVLTRKAREMLDAPQT